MSDVVHPNVTRVVEAGRALGLAIVTRRFPEGTKTAQDAATAIGVSVGQIVKSLVFAVDGEIVMAYVSGANQLDEKKLAAAAGGTKCSRVDADAVREATGFPIGGVYDEVWAAAGTWNDVFPITPNHLVRASGGAVSNLKRS
ncbi:MAG: YbaK/EbsC family protein [Acidimicrobiia bacterium]|nr:YbaK/EbsC family protein [Acidimicrobiia bacterium]